MTLPERLAREALPCRRHGPWCEDVNDGRVCSDCQRRPAVEAAIRKAIEACAEIADTFEAYNNDEEHAAAVIETRIRNLGDRE